MHNGSVNKISDIRLYLATFNRINNPNQNLYCMPERKPKPEVKKRKPAAERFASIAMELNKQFQIKWFSPRERPLPNQTNYSYDAR